MVPDKPFWTAVGSLEHTPNPGASILLSLACWLWSISPKCPPSSTGEGRAEGASRNDSRRSDPFSDPFRGGSGPVRPCQLFEACASCEDAPFRREYVAGWSRARAVA